MNIDVALKVGEERGVDVIVGVPFLFQVEYFAIRCSSRLWWHCRSFHVNKQHIVVTKRGDSLEAVEEIAISAARSHEAGGWGAENSVMTGLPLAQAMGWFGRLTGSRLKVATCKLRLEKLKSQLK